MSRTMIVVLLPIAMLVGFFGTLFREIGSAFKCAYLEAMIEFEHARREWHRS